MVKRKGPTFNTGGPSTFHGVAYQTEVSVYFCLQLCIDNLQHPAKNNTITLEARHVQSLLSVGWDISTTGPEKFYEVKSRPTNAEITSWLKSCSAVMKPMSKYVFVYCETGDSIRKRLKEIERISDIAREVEDDDDFRARVLFDGLDLSLAGDGILTDSDFDKWKLLQVLHLQEDLLKTVNEAQAYALTDSGASGLLNYLRSRLVANATKRTTESINKILSDTIAIGVDIRTPVTVATVSTESAFAALYALSVSVGPLPDEVLAKTLGISIPELESALSTFIANKTVGYKSGIVCLTHHPQKISIANSTHLLRSLLLELLAYMRNNSKKSIADVFVHSVIRVAQKCANTFPDDVSSLFGVLDKVMKRSGRKRLVLDCADLSIQTTRKAIRSTKIIAEEARSLVCGKAWVYQRRNQLDEAEASANAAKKLAIDIKDKEMESFCHKCIGRLYRMRAEAPEGSGDENAFFRKSRESLEQAIKNFEELKNDDEVGDSLSLLSRTCYAQRNYPEAEYYLDKAKEFVTDKTNKDYFDLLILQADLKIVRKEFKVADDLLSEAIERCDDADATQSEILARAFFRRGICRLKRLMRKEARSDLSSARDIWKELEEYDNAAMAEWELVLTEKKTSKDVLNWLSKVPVVYDRVLMLNIYLEGMSSSRTVVARRSGCPSTRQWIAIRDEAMRRKHKESIAW